MRIALQLANFGEVSKNSIYSCVNIGEFIARDYTGPLLSTTYRPLADESDASVSAELAGQIASTQAQLESHVEELRRAAVAGGDARALAQAEAQLGRLGGLARRLEHAGPGAVAALKAEVLAAAFAAQALGQQSRAAAATAQSAEAALHAAQADARKAVDDFQRDFYQRKIFEKDLHFADDAAERAYREREEQRRREIEKAQAMGTPEGDLRAATLMKEQLLDAGAHGARNNPAFQQRLDQATAVQQRLENAMGVRSTEMAVVERDPLDTLTPKLDGQARSALATFRAAGIAVTEATTIDHGVAVDARAPTAPGRGA